MKFSKGISPVIATVIIVAVAIAIAIAVAFWMGGIVGLFTRYEKLEIINAYADWNEDAHTWVVIVQVKNAGSSDATIDEIFINGKPHNAYASLKDAFYVYVYDKIAVSANKIFTVENGQDNDKDDDSKEVNVDLTQSTLGASNPSAFFDFQNGVPIKAGEEVTIIILIPGPGFKYSEYNYDIKTDAEVQKDLRITGIDFKHGASIEVKIHTAAGKEYPKEVVLP